MLTFFFKSRNISAAAVTSHERTLSFPIIVFASRTRVICSLVWFCSTHSCLRCFTYIINTFLKNEKNQPQVEKRNPLLYIIIINTTNRKRIDIIHMVSKTEGKGLQFNVVLQKRCPVIFLRLSFVVCSLKFC